MGLKWCNDEFSLPKQNSLGVIESFYMSISYYHILQLSLLIFLKNSEMTKILLKVKKFKLGSRGFFSYFNIRFF